MAENPYKELYQTKFYRAWSNMKTRCRNPRYIDFHRYGGRGIGFCNEWKSFGGFFKDMHEDYLLHVREFGETETTLERIDNNLGYSRDNCRWATKKEQAMNRRNNRYIEYLGMKKTIVDWANYLGLKRSTISQRFHVYKWSIERCFQR